MSSRDFILLYVYKACLEYSYPLVQTLKTQALDKLQHNITLFLLTILFSLK